MLKQHRVLALLSVFLMALIIGCAATQKEESTGEYIDDAAITAKVKAAIFNEPTLKVLQIEVQTYKGVVQLSGFVDSRDSAEKAGDVAGRVAGVKSVRNNLVVKGYP
jgi:osmotically-inducible protein OsmY